MDPLGDTLTSPTISPGSEGTIEPYLSWSFRNIDNLDCQFGNVSVWTRTRTRSDCPEPLPTLTAVSVCCSNLQCTLTWPASIRILNVVQNYAHCWSQVRPCLLSDGDIAATSKLNLLSITLIQSTRHTCVAPEKVTWLAYLRCQELVLCISQSNSMTCIQLLWNYRYRYYGTHLTSPPSLGLIATMVLHHIK